jgi:hypothetical protein
MKKWLLITNPRQTLCCRDAMPTQHSSAPAPPSIVLCGLPHLHRCAGKQTMHGTLAGNMQCPSPSPCTARQHAQMLSWSEGSSYMCLPTCCSMCRAGYPAHASSTHTHTHCLQATTDAHPAKNSATPVLHLLHTAAIITTNISSKHLSRPCASQMPEAAALTP